MRTTAGLLVLLVEDGFLSGEEGDPSAWREISDSNNEREVSQ